MSEHTDRTDEGQDQPQDAEVTPSRPDEEAAGGERGGDSTEAKGQERDYDAEVEEAKEEIKNLEENPPEKLEDWPAGKAKYQTFGGPEGEHGYHEGPEERLGPSALRHREDGSVEVEGEEVDDPEKYKGEPIPGGPTDPNTANLRMDKASPDDVSDVAKRAQEKEGDDSEERSEERS